MPDLTVVPYTCILYGLEAIAAYLHVSPRTVRRWIDRCALPVMQAPRGTWITSPTLIDSWILECWRYQHEQQKRAQGDTLFKEDLPTL
jgi:Helix-turn-helix domain